MPIERQRIPRLGTWFSSKNAYITTALTHEASASGASFLSPLGIMPVDTSGSDAQDHPMVIDETLRADGLVETPSSGTVTLKRQAAGATGLNVLTTMIGDPGGDRSYINGYGTTLRKNVSFSGTDVTVEVDCGGLQQVRPLGIILLTSATDSQDGVVFDEVKDSKGFIKVPATGTITLRRDAAGSSGLNMLVWLSSGDTVKIIGLGTMFSRVATFSGTNQTVEVDAGGYPNVMVFSALAFGNPVGTISAEDANLSIDETTDSKGIMDLSNATTFTLRRQVSGSSGGSAIVNMIGF